MIPDLKEKIKGWQEPLFTFLAVFLLVLCIAGGLRLYTISTKRFPIRYNERAFEIPNKDAGSPVEDMLYMASRTGQKYYPIDCKTNIKDENKIYFSSELEAQKAGFDRSKTCL